MILVVFILGVQYCCMFAPTCFFCFTAYYVCTRTTYDLYVPYVSTRYFFNRIRTRYQDTMGWFGCGTYYTYYLAWQVVPCGSVVASNTTEIESHEFEPRRAQAHRAFFSKDT
ncbi:unnamed protein product, partial [Laminaria digitata]